MIYLCVIMCLSVFKIKKPLGAELKVKLTSGIVCKSVDFGVVAKPRSERAEALIRLSEIKYYHEGSSVGLVKQ